MGDSDDDYMSETFLQKVQDKRPGLASRSTSRLHEQEKRHRDACERNRNKNRPLYQVEHEVREEGLGKAIDQDNKGFKILAKMGFKPGMAIGRQGQGRTEPVGISLKVDRTGLGHQNEQKRKADKIIEAYEAVKRLRTSFAESQTLDFRSRMRENREKRRAESDLRKSQRTCEQLDRQKGLDEPPREWFWPKEEKPKTEDEEEEEEEDETERRKNKVDEEQENSDGTDLPATDQLQIITEYLREEHLYCIWCATVFESTEDLTQNCAGNSADAHDDDE